jgi:hypothetical protein
MSPARCAASHQVALEVLDDSRTLSDAKGSLTLVSLLQNWPSRSFVCTSRPEGIDKLTAVAPADQVASTGPVENLTKVTDKFISGCAGSRTFPLTIWIRRHSKLGRGSVGEVRVVETEGT